MEPAERMPSLAALMTPFPYSIGAARTVAEAREMMSRHAIQHLPVTKDGRLMGVISDRDVLHAAAAELVGDRCSRDLYVVEMSTRLDEVLLHMAEAQIHSAVVTRHGRLAGIFTATDACRAFGDFLREHFAPGGGDEAA
jgi:acetoin utilization protein AcuB